MWKENGGIGIDAKFLDGGLDRRGGLRGACYGRKPDCSVGSGWLERGRAREESAGHGDGLASVPATFGCVRLWLAAAPALLGLWRVLVAMLGGAGGRDDEGLELAGDEAKDAVHGQGKERQRAPNRRKQAV